MNRVRDSNQTPLTGILRSWNDERGFGFIAPTHGGAEIFVHISAFPRDGSRPTVGEKLTYELGRGKNGDPQAVTAHRQAIGLQPQRPGPGRQVPRKHRSWLQTVIALLLLLAVGAYGYNRFQQGSTRHGGSEPSIAAQPVGANPAAETASFGCDGRTHCSQMRSCAEAKYFLEHCPGTKMDGNNDGVPCEQQWCTSLFAK
jgi:cold shock CspA family protein